MNDMKSDDRSLEKNRERWGEEKVTHGQFRENDGQMTPIRDRSELALANDQRNRA